MIFYVVLVIFCRSVETAATVAALPEHWTASSWSKDIERAINLFRLHYNIHRAVPTSLPGGSWIYSRAGPLPKLSVIVHVCGHMQTVLVFWNGNFRWLLVRKSRIVCSLITMGAVHNGTHPMNAWRREDVQTGIWPVQVFSAWVMCIPSHKQEGLQKYIIATTDVLKKAATQCFLFQESFTLLHRTPFSHLCTLLVNVWHK